MKMVVPEIYLNYYSTSLLSSLVFDPYLFFCESIPNWLKHLKYSRVVIYIVWLIVHYSGEPSVLKNCIILPLIF